MAQIPLVLASTSPYRKALLERLGLSFSIANPSVDETPKPREQPKLVARRLAIAKAHAAKSLHPNCLIIGADQTAFLGKKVLGKPRTHANAIKQLTMVSGKTVQFLTAVCVLDARSNRFLTRVVPNTVQFRKLSFREIEKYLTIDKPYDCAGSAKAEALGIALIKKMQGDDPNALIGLPLIALVDLLSKHGLRVL